MNIKSIGYLGIGAPDPAEWLRYGVDILGMMAARNIPGQTWGMPQQEKEDTPSVQGVAEDGSVYLKMDERQWRIGVHPNTENKGILYLGLEVNDKPALDEAVTELSDQGLDVRMGSRQEADGRAVSGIAYLSDPAGNNLELFYGPTTDYQFRSEIEGLEFVAGHLGLGHVNIFVPNLAESYDFYTQVLGFKLSDYIRFGPEAALKFIRCNARHHSLAMVEMGDFGGLQHLMIEMKTIDDVGKTLDRAMAHGIKITSSLGRHRNDGALSFYMRSPFGFDVEVGCECLQLDDTWTVNEFCEGDVWGHEGLAEAVFEASEVLKAKKPKQEVSS